MPLDTVVLDARIEDRIVRLPLTFLDGETFTGLRQLNKVVRKALSEDIEVYTTGTARFIHGTGVKASVLTTA